ncbi:MAG TPA: enolase C-terminal domain-like protein [Candidatus Acidoferrum sp.]|nr:enolase C-terminal domain-like protein [Candidatus Acidoferrum sp.]
MKSTDVRVVGTRLYFLPVETRVPLKFGTETLTSVTCARTCVTVEDAQGRRAKGWGETPLSVQWVWPGKLPYARRHAKLKEFTMLLARELPRCDARGHAFEIGADFQEHELPKLLGEFNADAPEPMPLLAALICLSLFDIATHDAFGQLHALPIYETYSADYLSRDLGDFLEERFFARKFPRDFLVSEPPRRLLAWHLVGGLDSLDASELTGKEPSDGYPVLLEEWIRRDGLKCLKVKLRGNDAAWDFTRLIRVGEIAARNNVLWLTADFNCTVTEPAYVNDILDRLQRDAPDTFDRLLYVEQPFPYELEEFPIDVHSVSQRKPLFLDESAHNWRLVRRGRELGWTGVALKTCKTQTGALLSACWAKTHGMQLMVQDLTNPMLAQIPHVMLAAHAGTIAGVETNAMQFYPEASNAEAVVHPGLYQRREGEVDWSSVRGPGFGYRIDEIDRELPPAAAEFGE